MVLGWGDIGYNYLIDQQGNIYEGRYGGVGTVGGHTYNSLTNTNYNEGSIGIAILGCFESADRACTTISTFTEPVQTALATLIGSVAAEVDLDPSGNKRWFSTNYPNVISHKDLDFTYCPGDALYAELDNIRQLATEKYQQAQTALAPYQAQWESSTLAETYNIGEEPAVTVTYTNNGTKTWVAGDVVMQISFAKTGEHQRVELPNTVEPNVTQSLDTTLTILPHKPGNYTVTTKLYRAGKIVPSSRQTKSITLTNRYTATITDLALPVAIRQGWTPTLIFTLNNTGSNDLPETVKILINEEIIGSLSAVVPVGNSQTISLPLTQAAILEPNSYQLVLRLRTKQEPVFGTRTIRSLRVDE